MRNKSDNQNTARSYHRGLEELHRYGSTAVGAAVAGRSTASHVIDHMIS
jgi:hypothetical protein